MVSVLSTTDLEKSYKGKLALKNCTINVPTGAVVALVGPNGAGKTTLLDIIAGLLPPSSGEVQLFERTSPGSLEALQRIGFVAQNSPLNKNITVINAVRITELLNVTFDREYALDRFRKLQIPLKRRIGQLSGGHKAQVALTLAIARRPNLLLLDEPLSHLDSLAREQFLKELMTNVAATGMSVIFSSHTITELEKVCDYLILIVGGEVKLCESMEDIIESHRMIACAPGDLDYRQDIEIIERKLGSRFATHLIRFKNPMSYSDLETLPSGLENIVLAYLRRGQEVETLDTSVEL
ncbi:MAG: ABC transporter ATP-binding protein [Actinomycetota bacterium]